jgi:hypothetical protein
VMLSMVSPIIVLSRGGLRVAPSNEWYKISVVSCHENEERSPLLGLVFALL